MAANIHKQTLVPTGVSIAQLSDCLDEIGLRQQILPPGIVPIDGSMRFAGRAFTVSTRIVQHTPSDRYVGLLKALDNLGAGDVYTIASAGDCRAALWGELLANSARARHAVAAVTDGAIRDAAKLLEMDFPTFAAATTPADIHGRFEVTSFGEPIQIGEVTIEAGDLIAGDIDGIVVIPKEAEGVVISKAEEKMAAESEIRDDLAGGMLPSQAFEKHGVL
jgi:4-hydroxy-4-methyl-2-oxoglutarate aldolase